MLRNSPMLGGQNLDPFLGPWKNSSDAQTGRVIVATSHAIDTHSFDSHSPYRSNPCRGISQEQLYLPGLLR